VEFAGLRADAAFALEQFAMKKRKTIFALSRTRNQEVFMNGSTSWAAHFNSVRTEKFRHVLKRLAFHWL
jgi:hypothetical protein